MRTLRPSLRRTVSPSTTRCTATLASGAGQKAWAPESQIADKKGAHKGRLFHQPEKPRLSR
jgi:hypothetical protein